MCNVLLTMQRRAQSEPPAPSGQRTAPHLPVSDAAPTLWMLFSQKKFCQFRTTDSSSQSLARVSAQRNCQHHSEHHCQITHSVCFCAPSFTWAAKEAGSHFVIFLCVRLNVEAVEKVCSYGECWRDSECLSQRLFAALFHASQPGSAINPEYPAVPAGPSPHRAPLLATAVH